MLQLINKRSKGFTLIELLVVIAIIGILSSIVLVSLNTARNKAKAVAVKAALSELRAAAEMSYDEVGDYDGVCAEDGGAASDSNLTTTAGTDFARIAASIAANGGGAALCNEAGTAEASTAWAAWATLATGGLWCVDSTGQSTGPHAAIAVDSTVCPAI